MNDSDVVSLDHGIGSAASAASFLTFMDSNCDCGLDGALCCDGMDAVGGAHEIMVGFFKNAEFTFVDGKEDFFCGLMGVLCSGCINDGTTAEARQFYPPNDKTQEHKGDFEFTAKIIHDAENKDFDIGVKIVEFLNEAVLQSGDFDSGLKGALYIDGMDEFGLAGTANEKGGFPCPEINGHCM